MAITAQQAVADYHRAMGQHAHHGGADMFSFHRGWHQQNPDPQPPSPGSSNWGVNLAFGTAFLQMHHEMVKARDDEPRLHMHHQSLVSWYAAQSHALPAEWDPLAAIPELLAYQPDLSVFPAALRARIEQVAQERNVTPESLLRRATDHPAFALPKWATRAGAGPGEPREPYTGARKLADFQNTNQLGCCIVFPHNRWHARIGGAMTSTATAIADPIFYFGVHWHIDKVFDEFKLILAERAAQPAPPPITDVTAHVEPPAVIPLTAAEQQQRAEDIALSHRLRGEPFALE